jgi:penicillin amidase
VLAPSRTITGRPIVASDPHIPYAAVSIWHEVHLRGGSFNVAGVALAGMPAVMIGRNERVAWGITNNICSQRDLYLEKTDPAHPGCFLYDGRWEPASEREGVIQVKGAEPVRKTIRFSRNGPIVDELLPPAARHTGPVALRWLGFEPCGWLTALVGMNRARTAAEFREATRPWHVPTFNVVFADADGHVGLQCTGRIPLRRVAERGYRPGWDPAHQWTGVIPFEDMPHALDPPRGFVVTANNRLAPDDYPYPLAGTWSSGHRARRIREQIASRPKLSAEDCRRLQGDIRSGRAAECLARLVALLDGDADARVRRAAEALRAWDGVVTADSVAATLFNVFFAHWCRTVTAERLPAELVGFVSANANGLASRLLADDRLGWFVRRSRQEAVRVALLAALDELTARLGPDPAAWRWGRLHTLLQNHFLSGCGDLGELLDRSGLPLPGDTATVCNNTPDADWRAYLGPGYRMITDFGDHNGGLWSVEVAGVSGHPGSPHYDDQLGPWSEGRYYHVPLDGTHEVRARLVLQS